MSKLSQDRGSTANLKSRSSRRGRFARYQALALPRPRKVPVSEEQIQLFDEPPRTKPRGRRK